jgi:regulator of protease activity HflC (stomatin/prohibitin superfamily)
MNKFSKIALACALALGAAACSKVPAGNVGVKFYLLGGDKGVDTEQLSPGRYWIGWNEELYLFPTFTQTYTWEGEEAIGFQNKDGLGVKADIGISYSIDPDKVPIIFQKYRKGIDEITDLYLRNMVRDALVKAASTRPIEAVYGAGKTDLIAEATETVRREVGPLGISVENIYWVGELRLPENVTNSINAKIQATQMAEQRRNEVEQAKAEAEKVRQTAQGEADALLLRAKAEAESIQIKGDALRDNPTLIELQAVEKWNGVLPVTMLGSGATPFITVPSK